MRKWLPLAVLGAGGLGALLLTTGRRFADAEEAPDPETDFNRRASGEIDRIQTALSRVAAALDSST
jgi:hypothetical protein